MPGRYEGTKLLVVRADCGPHIGTGHVMRCLALAQRWQDVCGQAVFVMGREGEALSDRLRAEGMEVSYIAARPGSAEDAVQTADLAWQIGAKWVVADGYHFDGIYQQRVKEAGHRLLMIDDMPDHKHYYADIILNQDLGAEQLSYSREPYTRLLLGTRYALLRREFLAWTSWKREIPEVARRVLVTLGGSDPENHTLTVIQALQEVDIPDLEAVVVIGACNLNADLLEATIRQSRISIRLIRNASNMPDLMAWADAGVSGGGGTVWELAFMGLPSLILMLADNQRLTISLLEARNFSFGLKVGACALAEEQIRNKLVTLLLDREARLRFSEALTLLIDGGGSLRVVDAMFQQQGAYK